MCVHLFGALSPSGCANFGLKQAANDGEAEFGAEAANFVQNYFYVDDGLKSVSTADEATRLICNIKRLLRSAGLHLHTFLCNFVEIFQMIPQDDVEKVSRTARKSPRRPMVYGERFISVQNHSERSASNQSRSHVIQVRSMKSQAFACANVVPLKKNWGVYKPCHAGTVLSVSVLSVSVLSVSLQFGYF